MKNGYAAANWRASAFRGRFPRKLRRQRPQIEPVLKTLGVKWLKTLRSYSVGSMVKALIEASTSKECGLKVIIADGECQLALQRRIRPQIAKGFERRQARRPHALRRRSRRLPGDHSCIRLSGCPSLTIAPNPDPLAA